MERQQALQEEKLVKDDPPMPNTEQPSVTCKLKKTNDQGTYDIFTADKVATYQILGWVKLRNVSSEEIRLIGVLGKSNRTLQKQKADKTDIFFYSQVRMAPHMKISIQLRSNYTDSLFHVCELRNQVSSM
ncbi:hypothetical protein INR49_008745 [Caranx melampygus]|nr:hypothetical protein INR49_008745 [Caranx melampygus]